MKNRTATSRIASAQSEPASASRRRFGRAALVPLAAAALPVMLAHAQAQAQAGYPDRPIRIVVPFPPGGATDIIARDIAQRLTPLLGQTVLVDNRAGASGNIGMAEVARAAADGYTLMMGAAQTLTINHQIFRNLSFHPAKDFVPVVAIASVPNVLLVSPKLPVKTPQELLEYAKANPGKLNYGSSSIGGTPHLSAELYKSLTNTYIVHIPYKGSAPALQDLMGGQIEMMFDNLPAALPHIKSGRVRAVAVTTLQRAVAAPELPTLDESGVKGFDSQGWFGLVAPAGTPDAIVQRINAEANKILATDEFKARLAQAGAIPVGGSTESFRQRMVAETERWGKVIKSANVTAD